MYAHAQRRLWQDEAGGEIFSAAPDASGLIITSAAGPNAGDRRSRHSWNPDTAAADLARHNEFTQGRHAVGLWHTHPEISPTPSSLDRETTQAYLKSFLEQRSRYLMVIIGNHGKTLSMAVWAFTCEAGGRWEELKETSNTVDFQMDGREGKRSR
ncbi:hypothetical protein DB032_19445 [Chromobacterium sp. Panama]|uniref:Mov34/MPN/PAD-1 family protein n=1 Tax=Chromobacterium sp. Panama TaxID=2161826 RepID=UPI000D31EE53|nr:hypothetical protein DB032_19445 [Chromobacterium sp. Panama]